MSRRRIWSGLYKLLLILFLIAFVLLPFHRHNHRDPYFHSGCGACILSIDFAAVITSSFIVFVFILIHSINRIARTFYVPTRLFAANTKRAPPLPSSL